MRAIELSRQAERALRQMPANDATRVKAKIAQLARDPASLANNVKRLKGSGLFRLRVGDWRVIYDDDGRILAVLKISSRGSAYGV